MVRFYFHTYIIAVHKHYISGSLLWYPSWPVCLFTVSHFETWQHCHKYQREGMSTLTQDEQSVFFTLYCSWIITIKQWKKKWSSKVIFVIFNIYVHMCNYICLCRYLCMCVHINGKARVQCLIFNVPQDIIHLDFFETWYLIGWTHIFNEAVWCVKNTETPLPLHLQH